MNFRIDFLANPILLCFFFLLSLIPAGTSGSLYEIYILPLIILFSCYLFLSSKYNSTLLLSTIITFAAFILASINNIDDPRPILVTILRIYSLLFFLSLLVSTSSDRLPPITNSFRSVLRLFFVPSFIVSIIYLSISKALNASYFNGIDYPFYTQESVNRQLFGPSMTITASYLFVLLSSLLLPRFDFISLRYKFFVFITAFLTLTTGLLSGSRAPFFILMLDVIIITVYFLYSPSYRNIFLSFCKYLFRPKIFYLFLSVGSITAYYLSSFLLKIVASIEFSDRAFSRIFGFFDFLSNPTLDASRGSKILLNYDYLQNFHVNFLGSYSPDFHLDSALVTFGSYFGSLFVICFASLLLLFSFKNPLLLLISLSTISMLLFGGLVFLSPRFYLLPFAVISLINKHFAFDVGFSSLKP